MNSRQLNLFITALELQAWGKNWAAIRNEKGDVTALTLPGTSGTYDGTPHTAWVLKASGLFAF